MCKSIKDARNLFNGLEALYIHFSIPSKNMMLVDIQEKLGIKKTKLCSISDTRWSCRFKNCKMVMEHYSSIIKVLKYEIEENTDKNVANAIGILYTMEKTSFLEKTATLSKASQVIDSVIATLEANRCEEHFLTIWTQITEFCTKNHILLEISMNGSKRKRTQPNKLSNYITEVNTGESEEHSSNDIMTCYRVKYFIILDTVIMNLKIRFSKESMELAKSVDGFLMFDYSKSLTFINHYKNLLNIDLESLKAEMMVAQNLKKQSTDNKMMTPAEMAEIVSPNTFPNLYKLLNVAYTIPISSATCERAFSAMRRVKNWLRSTMLQDRFSNLSLLSIERDLTNNIDSDTVLEHFIANNKNRRIDLNM
ncbi:uncharacterized protein LOC112601275 [Melanaphis sacchari]|uniref:uncharacterized protein LOC112601275 n=1 Tax=Melanaphis sacchari TaxID=742174 RepID=UPI000DC149F8|nr:uncharacterized protein LOC112601275 [Melanaphis sacchari]